MTFIGRQRQTVFIIAINVYRYIRPQFVPTANLLDFFLHCVKVSAIVFLFKTEVAVLRMPFHSNQMLLVIRMQVSSTDDCLTPANM